MGIKMRFFVIGYAACWTLPDCDTNEPDRFNVGDCTDDAECPSNEGCHNAACARTPPGQPCTKQVYGGGLDCRRSVSVCGGRRLLAEVDDDDSDFDDLSD